MDVHKRTWFLRDFCREFETQPVVLILMKFAISQQRAGKKQRNPMGKRAYQDASRKQRERRNKI